MARRSILSVSYVPCWTNHPPARISIIVLLEKVGYNSLSLRLNGGEREVASANSKVIRSLLEIERKRIEEELNQLKAGVKPLEERREGSPFGKREEEATETLELEKRLALENRLNGLLTEVDRALRKLDEGTYGICDSCGKSIDPARLEALPQANLCMVCRSAQGKYAKSKPPAG